MASWSIRGDYMETCNCTLVCPCITSSLTETPTEGDCKAAVTMHIEQGARDGVVLDDLSFIVMLHSPGPMAAGNITVGLIVDARASQEQVDAITAIATGAAGGPMAALAPLVGRFAGVEKRPIVYTASGLDRAVSAGELVDQACTGLASPVAPGEAIMLDNVAHPVSTRVALAKATRSLFNAFGIVWKDTTGTRNGHFAPFAWSA